MPGKRRRNPFDSLKNARALPVKNLKSKVTTMNLYRYAIDRLDQENNLVRLEIVPAAQGMTLERLKKLSAQNKAESLDWWDLSKSSMKEKALSKFEKQLGIDRSTNGGTDEQFQLAENMVFWIYGTNEVFEVVISATGPARALTKKLYMQVLKSGRGEDSPGSPE